MNGEHYLGDGLYASFDGWQFCLRAPGDAGDQMVFLEPAVLHEFQRYVKHIQKAQVEAVTRPAETQPGNQP